MADGRYGAESNAGFVVALRIRLALDRTVERGQHALHFPQLLLKLPSLARVEDSEGATAF